MKSRLPLVLLICMALCVLLSSCPNPAAAPATPAGLSVGSSTVTSLNISWDSVSDATSYQLCRDTSADGTFETAPYDGADTSFADSGLRSGITYYYKVKATSSAGSSPLSEAASRSTLAFVYVANYDSNNVSAFVITGTTGALTAVTSSPFMAGTWPLSVTVDSSGRFLYTANNSTNDVSAFSINGTTGALKEVTGSPFTAGTSPRCVTTTR